MSFWCFLCSLVGSLRTWSRPSALTCEKSQRETLPLRSVLHALMPLMFSNHLIFVGLSYELNYILKFCIALWLLLNVNVVRLLWFLSPCHKWELYTMVLSVCLFVCLLPETRTCRALAHQDYSAGRWAAEALLGSPAHECLGCFLLVKTSLPHEIYVSGRANSWCQ